jgi:ABC-type uncharacterized transport system permease subunit
MSTDPHSHVDLPEPITPEKSPFLPQHLVDLYLRPRRFFGGQLALGKTPYALFVAWAYGAVQAASRLDGNLMRAELGNRRPGMEQVLPYIAESGPLLLSFVVYTLVFPHYAAAYASEELLSVALLGFAFWSVGASYIGARTVFGLEGWRVKVWFLILPLLVLLFAFLGSAEGSLG